jgi:hypothetical protein
LYLAVYALLVAAIFAVGLDAFIAAVRKDAPEVPSSAKLRAAIIKEILEYYPNAKTVLDIGACYGGMARAIAKAFPNKKISGIEIMPIPFAISGIMKFFRGPKNMDFHLGDAMKFIRKSKGYDIGVAWLLTPMMERVESVADKFGVLLVLDFPLPNRAPARVVRLHKTNGWRIKPYHMLYVYEN